MRRSMLLMALASLPVLSLAADEAQKVAETQTDTWLALQRSGQVASTHPQNASAAERERSFERWLKSFEHPIPVFFEEQGDMEDGN
jgi:hypothetical protein